MRIELKQLRDELNELKKVRAPDSTSANEMPAKTAGIPGGFLIPGSQTTLHVYGIAESHAIHDFKQTSAPDVFTDLSFQPLDKSGGQKGKTQFTAETTRLGFETSSPAGNTTLNTKIEADFYSYGTDNRNHLRLRHAYGEYAGWLVGQTWSTFMDLDDLPETVDFNGPVGAPFSRRTMVRYTFGDAAAGYKLSFAAEDPADQFNGGSTNERMPQLIARFEKSFSRGGFNMRTLAHEKRSFSETKRGYGVGIGGNFKLTEKDVLMAQYTRVDGDVDQLYGSNGYAIDATTGAISFDRNQGAVFGYARTINDKLRGNVALGFNRGKAAQAIDNRTLGELFMNVIYSPIKNVELGGEYIYGKRRTFNTDAGRLSRLDLMGRYSF